MNVAIALKDRFPESDSEQLQKYIDICTNKTESCNDDYFENHHILPKHEFPEYENLSENKWNCAKLSYVNHCLAHYHFAKAVNTGPAWCAISAMLNMKSEDNKRISSDMSDEDVIRLAEIGAEFKKSYRGELHHLFGKPAHFKGRTHTEETKSKLREINLGKVSPNKGRVYGKNPQLTQSKTKNNPLWNELKKEMFELWLLSGKKSKVGFSTWLSNNTKHTFTDSALSKLLNQFKTQGFVPPIG